MWISRTSAKEHLVARPQHSPPAESFRKVFPGCVSRLPRVWFPTLLRTYAATLSATQSPVVLLPLVLARMEVKPGQTTALLV